MSSLLSSASIPVFKLMLGNLKVCLEKAQAHAVHRGFDAQVFVDYRLAPDMLPFKKQVLIACDSAKLCVARIAQIEAPKFEDNETEFAQLIERVGKTLQWIETVSPEAMDQGAGREITFAVGKTMTKTMKAEDYLTQWALPNMFFHITTTYTILRHNGVPLGKMDYLAGSLPA
ncbi:MAG: DUF1993 family protein [Burkholderiaceae bacterium]|jgi:uncharacterized protein